MASGKSSVDINAAKIVFFCEMNQVCSFWQAVLDGRSTATKSKEVLRRVLQSCLAMINTDGREELRQLLLYRCASSGGFVQICLRIGVAVLEGSLALELHDEALQMLKLLQQCQLCYFSQIAEVIASNGDAEWFAGEFHNIKSTTISNPAEVEIVAQNVILSLLILFIKSRDKSMTNTVVYDTCKSLLEEVQNILVPSISIRCKALLSILARTLPTKFNPPLPLTSSDFEFVAECLFEIAATKSSSCFRFNIAEILDIYDELIASDPTNTEVFAAFNVLSDEDLVQVKDLALPIETGAPECYKEKCESIHQCVLSDFKSKFSDDPNGIVMIAVSLLREITGIITASNKKLDSLSFEDANSIKTIISSVVQLVAHCASEDQKRVADEVATKFELQETLLQLLCNHDYFSVRPYGILVSMSSELMLVLCASNSSTFCSELSKAGGFHLLLKQLYYMSQQEYNKVTETILVGHLTALFKCICSELESCSLTSKLAVEPLLPSSKLALRSLLPLAVSSDRDICLLSKVVLSFLVVYVDKSHISVLELNIEEASTFVRLLTLISDSKQASISLLTFSSHELLKSVINLLSIPVNRALLLDAGITTPIKSLLFHEDVKTQENSLHLLWILLSDAQLSLADLDITFMLCFFQQSPCFTLHLLGDCCLRNIIWNDNEDVNSCYMYALANFHYENFEDCISWCCHVIDILKLKKDWNHMIADCTNLLGKALGQQYSEYQLLLENQKDYFTAADIGKDRDIRKCYEMVKSCILTLGDALDLNAIDKEGSMILDFAMLDYAREVDKLNDCRRCLLCRQKKKLCRSHICPESVMKLIAKTCNEEGAPHTVVPATGKHDIRTPGTDTKWLFCSACEQVFSRNGEVQFFSKFFRKNYPIVKSSSVEYNQHLFNFCAGMAFRSLCLLNFRGVCNTSEIYDLFISCREHLVTVGKDVLNQKSCLQFFILLNPSAITSTESVREELLSNVLQSNFQVHLSRCHLESGEESKIPWAHFLMIILGNVTIVFKFKVEDSFLMPSSFVPIKPSGGIYSVQSESQRWLDLPSGIISVIKDSVVKMQSRLSEVFWGKIPVSSTHKSKQYVKSWDSEVTSLKATATLDPLQSIKKTVFAELFADMVTEINLLPEGFKIVNTHNLSSVTLPSGHMILKHLHSKEKDATLFLSASSSGFLVLVFYKFALTEMRYGFRVEIGDGEYTIRDLPVSSPVQGAKSAFISSRFVSGMTEVLESIFQKFGNLQAMSHHSKISRICRNDVWISVDGKCTSDGCWYCRELCHSCMKRASVGFSKLVEGKVWNHCSEKCMLLHFEDSTRAPIQAKLLHFETNESPMETVLLQATKVFKTKLSNNTVTDIQLCISHSHPNIPAGIPYALLHIKARDKSFYLSFLISHDLSVGEPLWYVCHPDTVKSIDDIRELGLIQDVLHYALKSNVTDLETLISPK